MFTVWANLALFVLELIIFKGLREAVTVTLITLMAIGDAYYVFRFIRLYRLVRGKSFLSEGTPERRMVTMTYDEAVDRIKKGLPVDMTWTTDSDPKNRPWLGPPPPIRRP